MFTTAGGGGLGWYPGVPSGFRPRMPCIRHGATPGGGGAGAAAATARGGTTTAAACSARAATFFLLLTMLSLLPPGSPAASASDEAPAGARVLYIHRASGDSTTAAITSRHAFLRRSSIVECGIWPPAMTVTIVSRCHTVTRFLNVLRFRFNSAGFIEQYSKNSNDKTRLQCGKSPGCQACQHRAT